MTHFSLLMRNLRYFRWSNLAVGGGMVVATAVLTGAMMVGDSVRESLRVLAVQRLGQVDHAMVAGRFFGEGLADRIGASVEFGKGFEQVHAGILVKGGAGNEDGKERTAGVQIGALSGNWAAVAKDTCVINSEIAAALPSVKPGRKVLFSVPKLEDGPRDATLAKRGRADVISELTVQPKLARVASEAGFEAMFNLAGGQRLPRNAWLNLSDVQEAVGQVGRANVLLVHAKEGGSADQQARVLQGLVHELVTLSDYGLNVNESANAKVVLSSSDTYLPRAVDEAADLAAKEVGTTLQRVSSYLVNTAQNVDGKKEIHYAMIAGLSSLDDKPMAADEIVLNQWAAERLGAKAGDEIKLNYYHRDTGGDLKEVTSDGMGMRFKVARILPMSGTGADPALTPVYKGLTDSDSISKWEAPAGVTIHKEWVTKEDEAYWKAYKAAPKLFVSLEAARKLWGGPYGDVTSIRVPAENGEAFAAALRGRIDPAAMGMIFRPVRAEQLAATGGSTDFAELFIYFSFFLIAAAVLLVAMLFRLNIEQRARQLGLLAAVGFTPKALRRMALKEGMMVAVIGAAMGLVAAVGYTALMMAGLRTWWIGAVGTSAMHLHVVPKTLAYGFVSSVLIAGLAILWGVWRVGRVPAGQLLAGGWGTDRATHARGRWGMRIGWGLLAMAVLMLGAGGFKVMSRQEAFMGGGTLLLAAGLTLLGGGLRPSRGGKASDSISTLGYRNASRNTARSVLTMGLIAFATFALVTVAAFRGAGIEEGGDAHSGTGGYRLMMRADIPLLGDLNTPAGRDILAIGNTADPLWPRLKFTPMRRWAGEDISCLNLTRPGSPTILSVPLAMSTRAPFTIAGHVDRKGSPWEWLEETTAGQESIPVIADDETATYILHLDMGNSIEVVDQSGMKRKLVLVATLKGSVFQGELLMGEANFRALFPSQSGAGVVMVEADLKDAEEASKMLGSELGDYSVTVDRTTAVLAMYENVKGAYMSTFQVLGSLGLLLGTMGLVVVLLRGLVERKSELAMLAAIGFKRLDRLKLVLAENLLLLLLGLGLGTTCALVGMLPVLAESARQVHLGELLLTLLGVLAAGSAALVAAVWFGGRGITPAALRAE